MVYFISSEWIRSHSNIEQNISDKFLISAIRETQTINLQSIIGSSLYNSLYEKVENDNVSGYYKVLLEQIQYFMLYQTLANICIIVSYKTGNTGIVTTSDSLNGVNNASLSEVFKIQAHYQSRADFYQARIEDFMREYKDEFPELTCGCTCNGIAPNFDSAANLSPIFLGGNRGRITRKKCCK